MTTITFDRFDRLAAPMGLAVRNTVSAAARTLGADLVRVRTHIQERARKRRAAAALRGMSDTFFRDIGMHRSEINSVVLGGDTDGSRRCRG